MILTDRIAELELEQRATHGRSVLVLDDFMVLPRSYRDEALRHQFKRIDFGHIAFEGIAQASLNRGLPIFLQDRFPHLTPKLSVFRKSPYGQVEPNFIHCDIGLGDWTAVLYLNPHPAKGDGTDFWIHNSGAISGTPEFAVEAFKEDSSGEIWRHVEAKFNRLLLFSAGLFHSRSLFNNYGEGDDARLIQVVFGTGQIE